MFRVNSNDARVPDTALRVRRGAACDGGMGDACAAPEADSWTSDTMAVEYRRSNGKYCAASADSSRRSSWLRLLLQRARMGIFQCDARADLVDDFAVGRNSRFRDLPAARDVSCGADTLASASNASRGPGL